MPVVNANDATTPAPPPAKRHGKLPKILREIESHSEEWDKPILKWLFRKYHLSSQWGFVATCTHERYGEKSYETNRVWKPTREGRILFEYEHIYQWVLNDSGGTGG